MSFTSYLYLGVFLPVSLAVYWLLQKQPGIQNRILAVISYGFYLSMRPSHPWVILICLMITYSAGVLGGRVQEKGRRDIYYKTAIICLILILLIFKYSASILQRFHFKGSALYLFFSHMPLGLSFAVFTCMAYLISLIRGTMKPELNLASMSLYVLFYPAVISGPIKQAEQFFPQIGRKKHLTFESFERAVAYFLWGTFLKMVVADRISVFTGTVFSNYTQYGGETILIAVCLYSIELYTDFWGYSCMALSIAALYGYQLELNFHHPYFARNIREFWKRWHISLTNWLTKNVYIPLGGSKKGIVRRILNIIIVFVISGLWHGNTLGFLVWGLLHGIWQVASILTESVRGRACAYLKVDRNSKAHHFLQQILVFLGVSFAWIFFRMSSTREAFSLIRQMITVHDPWILFDYSLLKTGLSIADWHVIIVSILVVWFAERWTEKKDEVIFRQSAVARILIYIGLILAVIVFGQYGPAYSASNFIYAGF